jgi:hypothetical protein
LAAFAAAAAAFVAAATSRVVLRAATSSSLCFLHRHQLVYEARRRGKLAVAAAEAHHALSNRFA